MTPLDLRKAPPPSPRDELRGLCMLPRMIDIARAILPGGNIGEYQLGRGMSASVLSAFSVPVSQFVEIVDDAKTDEDVAQRLWPSAVASLDALNARLRSITVRDVPLELQLGFQRLYGADLPKDLRVFDVLDADDGQAFPRQEP
jgi:hypothetical protein